MRLADDGRLAVCLDILRSRKSRREEPLDAHGREPVATREDGSDPGEEALLALAERAVKGGARASQPALVNGAVGVVVAPRGRLLMVLRFTIAGGKIVEIDAVADPERLGRLDLSVLGD